MTWLSFCDFRIFERKSCSQNVGEIETRSKKDWLFWNVDFIIEDDIPIEALTRSFQRLLYLSLDSLLQEAEKTEDIRPIFR